MKKIAEVTALYAAIERELLNSKEPLCAIDMYAKPDVNKLAASSDKVSNILAYLYHTKRVKRVPFKHPTAKTVRFAYTLDAALSEAPPPTKHKRRNSRVEMTLRVSFNGETKNLSLEEAKKLRDSLNEFFRSIKT